jgi:diguanylate cyclase (GGDEF)-like protein/PAS domain S-box-containing protein
MQLSPNDEAIFVEKILGASEALVLVLDAKGRIVHFDLACERLSGYQAAEVIGRPVWDVLNPPGELERSRTGFLELIERGSTAASEGHWRTRAGELRLIRWEQVCLTGPAGEIAYVVATGTDVTGRRASEALLKRELTLMHTLMENLPNQIYFKDRQSRFIRTNRALALRLGEGDPDHLAGKTDFDYFTDEHARQAFQDEQEILTTGQVFNSEEKETRAGFPDAWVLTTKLPLCDSEGAIVGTFGMSIDITERKTAEDELRIRAHLFAGLAEFAATVNAIREPERLAEVLVEAMSKVVASQSVIIALLDRADGKYYVRSICGLSPATIGSVVKAGEGTTGRTISEETMIFTEPGSPNQVNSALQAYMPPGLFRTVGVPLLHEGLVLGAISIARPDTEPPFSLPEREVLALLGAHTALALANARLSAEVSALAIHDGLTGLYNRRHFDFALKLALARAKRRLVNKTLAAIMFDLDHFRDFNERYGHLGGDALLRHFAGLLGARLRAADIVARYGGEEFVAILEDCSLADAERLAEDVRRDLEESFVIDAKGRKMQATVSAGCACLDPLEPTVEALIGAADLALYEAKRAGRNQVVLARLAGPEAPDSPAGFELWSGPETLLQVAS